MRLLKKFLAGLVLSLFLVVPVFAAPVIDFTDGDGAGGTIVALGGGNYQGINIALDSLEVTGTLNAGVYDLTGLLTASADPHDQLAASLNFNSSTGVISIVGGVTGTGIASDTTLLSGTITNFNVTPYGSSILISASGYDIKDGNLLKYFGIDESTNFTFLSFLIGIDTVTNSNGINSYYVNSVDISNTATPIPGAIWLLGSGLVGLVGIRRRRFNK
jgi:hypothetical protein